MPTFGKLVEYNETEDWRGHYIERVNHFFEANEITDPDQKRSTFLVSVGGQNLPIQFEVWPLQTIRMLKPMARPVPRPSAIVQRFKFNTSSQKPGETIAMFLSALRHLPEHYEFGTTLYDMLS